jgi:hypothetical protein
MARRSRQSDASNLAGHVYYEIDQIHVSEWHPLPDGQGPPEQVHMTIRIKRVPYPVVMRFKGPQTLDGLIAALQEHRDNVWPATEDRG